MKKPQVSSNNCQITPHLKKRKEKKPLTVFCGVASDSCKWAFLMLQVDADVKVVQSEGHEVTDNHRWPVTERR